VNGKTTVATISSLTLFIVALLSMFFGIMYAAKEVLLGYKILRIETKNILYEE
jgi:1,4-dihydroxy-2-naphthoate octaprenyltransferase